MTFHTHPDWQALLRTICTYPEADLPRLVAADWLEERAEMEPCEACGHDGGYFDSAGKWNFCERCSGTAFVSPMAEYAEFIRLQCEIAYIIEQTGGHEPPTCMMERQRELVLGLDTSEWFGPRLPGLQFTNHRDAFAEPHRITPCALVFRGFVSEVRAPLAWLIGGGCEACGGEGQARFYHPIEIERVVDCDTCHGTGRTTGHLDELVRTQPVTRVVVTDAIRRVTGGGWGAPHDFQPMPLEIWEEFSGTDEGYPFETEEAATTALSLALLNPARERAGLPAIHPATLEVVR